MAFNNEFVVLEEGDNLVWTNRACIYKLFLCSSRPMSTARWFLTCTDYGTMKSKQL